MFAKIMEPPKRMKTRKIALILVDGMRPDGLLQANAPALKRLMAKGAYSLKARSVLPSLTLPCITSLILGVNPQAHGTLTNTFSSNHWQAPGLIDVLHDAGYKTASFTNWEQLRDLSQPGSLDLSICINTSEHQHLPPGESDRSLISISSLALRQQPVDFTFLYLGCVDTAGHMHGWMTPEYIQAIENADRCIELFLAELPVDTRLFITADHGGIGKSHGFDSEDEMLIPLIIAGADLPAGEITGQVSILDIAPTILDYAGITPPAEWQGKVLPFKPD
jgi:predicted AlkP superfamily pyrophosphatase or phosphodiesterase